MDFQSVLAKVPAPVLLCFAIIGAISALKPVLSYVRLLLSLFALSGKSVRISTPSHPPTHTDKI